MAATDTIGFAHLVHSPGDIVGNRRPAMTRLFEILTLAGTVQGFTVHDAPETEAAHIRNEMVSSLVMDDENVEAVRALPPPFATMPPHVMHVRQLSNALKHEDILRVIALKHDHRFEHRFELVLEDDVLFDPSSVASDLADLARHAPADADMIFLGSPYPKNLEKRSYVPMFDVYEYMPTCEAYLITPLAAKKLMDGGFFPLRFATNVHLSCIIKRESLCAYVSTPPIFVDGSKLGTHTSSLNANNRLIWNGWYMTVSGILRAAARLPASETEERARLLAQTTEVFAGMNFRTHPDARFLYALTCIARGDNMASKKALDDAYELYVANNCILNRTSRFLNTYCDSFRDVSLSL